MLVAVGMLVAVAVVVAAAAPAACIAAALYRAPASTMISLPVNIRVTAARLVLARAYTRECMHAGKGEAWLYTYRWPRSHTHTHTHALTHSLTLPSPSMLCSLSLHSSHHPPPPSHHLTRSHTHTSRSKFLPPLSLCSRSPSLFFFPSFYLVSTYMRPPPLSLSRILFPLSRPPPSLPALIQFVLWSRAHEGLGRGGAGTGGCTGPQ